MVHSQDTDPQAHPYWYARVLGIFRATVISGHPKASTHESGPIEMEFLTKNFEYLPFGAGRRICPGVSFGMANVELPLALLLYHFDWELPNGNKKEDVDMAEDFAIVTRRKNHLYLIPIPYYRQISN